MKKYSPINVFPDGYNDEGLSVGVVCGGKRKRDVDVMYNSATLVNLESTIKVEECESVGSCENL
ncbi:hypothetical protein Bca52824_015764 [Brassica carinata]|uniref:Uncharacterized protein n=1 Tax=Brassica carinata TaxID=52824 RepID=A0A8X7W2M4_BRACI|nr:hypothetical protein Bca52824_015764 [Brassica carinata]